MSESDYENKKWLRKAEAKKITEPNAVEVAKNDAKRRDKQKLVKMRSEIARKQIVAKEQKLQTQELEKKGVQTAEEKADAKQLIDSAKRQEKASEATQYEQATGSAG